MFDHAAEHGDSPTTDSEAEAAAEEAAARKEEEQQMQQQRRRHAKAAREHGHERDSSEDGDKFNSNPQSLLQDT